MPTFDASTVTVEDLKWDFHGFGVKAKGEIPEPSDVAIGKFLDDIKTLYTKAKGSGLDINIPEDAGPEQMMAALASVTGDAYVEFMAGLAEIFAELCSDKPTKANLLALPMRVRVKFFAWVQEQVVSPEAGTGAGIAQVTALPSAAAG
jgi:hypothetical protein